MNIRKVCGIITSASFVAVVLLNFQNCAAPSGELSETNSYIDDGSMVQIVDNFVKNKVAFVERVIVLHDETLGVNVDGLCSKDQSGTQLNWDLMDVETGNIIDSNLSECHGGGFRVQAENLANMICEKDYNMKALGESGLNDSVIIRKKCAPVESAFDDNASTDSLLCYMETENTTSQEALCYRSCYKDNKLYSRESTDLDECQKLSASIE